MCSTRSQALTGCTCRAGQGMLAHWQRRWHSTQSAALEIEDTLKVAALIHSFRNDGHLAAALDPLQRVRQGPWLAESRQATTWYARLCTFLYCRHSSLYYNATADVMCRSNSKLGTLLHSLPQDDSSKVEASVLASKLGLSLPTTDHRQGSNTFNVHKYHCL